MALSDVSLVNSSLIKLGVERIVALTDTSKQAVLANEQYEKIRDDLLSRYFWDFAIKRAELVVDIVAPDFEWEQRFALPADCLRPIYIFPHGHMEWVKEGSYILCNSSADLQLVYVHKVTDTTKFSSTFDEALALRLAYELAYPLVQSVTLKDQLYKEYKNEIRDVRSLDSMIGTPYDLNDDVWLRARIGGSAGGSPYFGSFRRFP